MSIESIAEEIFQSTPSVGRATIYIHISKHSPQ